MAIIFKDKVPLSNPDKIPLSNPYTNPLSNNFLNSDVAGKPTNGVQPNTNKGIKADTTKVAPKTNTIPSSMAKPMAKNMATLYGPNQGDVKQVDIGSPEASNYQNMGWGLKPGTYKAPGTSTNNGVQQVTDQQKQNLEDAAAGRPVYSPSTAGNDISQKRTLQDLAQVNSSNPGNSGPAHDEYMKSIQELKNFQSDYAMANAGLGNAGNSLQAVTGQQQNLQTANSAKLAALQAAVSEKATALSQQVSGQQVQNNALLGSAGQMAPQFNQFGNAIITRDAQGNIIQGAVGGNTSSNPLANISSIASQVLNHQISPSQAKSLGGTVSNWSNMLNQELQKQSKGSYNEAQLEGQYAASQANTQTGGTAAVNANLNIYNQAANDYANLVQSVSNVDEFGKLLSSGMLKDKYGGTINPTQLTVLNKSIADFKSMLSSESQGQFESTLAALRGKISGLLAIGGSQIPTDISAEANKILDGSAPVSTINSVLNRIQTEGKILLNSQANKLNQALKNTQGGNSSSGNSGKTSDGYNYTIIQH